MNIMLVAQKEKLKKELPNIIKKYYDINVDLVDILAWGYQSVAFYVEAEGKIYTVRTDINTPQNKAKTEKEIYLSGILHQYIPTAEYINNMENNPLTEIDQKILRVSKYIKGTAPFKMNMDILEQAVKILSKIHSIDFDKINLDTKLIHHLDTNYKDAIPRLLHGDLTPSNIIVADNIVVGVLDFADSSFGPIEWDLAHTCVFSWYRMHEFKYEQIIEKALNTYKNQVNLEYLYKFSLTQVENHLKKIIDNKANYDNEQFWNDDYNFTKKCYEEIKKL